MFALAATLAWSSPKRAMITYYCQGGITASGTVARPGEVAVDPKVIPLGTLLKIDGEVYRAEDTGGFVHGYHIDVFIRSCIEAIRRGVKHTWVRQSRGWR